MVDVLQTVRNFLSKMASLANPAPARGASADLAQFSRLGEFRGSKFAASQGREDCSDSAPGLPG